MEDERNKKKQSEMQHGQLKDRRIFIAVLLFMNSIKRGCLFEDNKEASRYINRLFDTAPLKMITFNRLYTR